MTALQVNPFVKFRGLEVFGVIERAEGKASTEAADRTGTSTPSTPCIASCPTRSCSSASATTRPTASSPASPVTSGAERWQVGGGWFITARPAGQGRVREPEVLRLPADQHQERRKVPRR